MPKRKELAGKRFGRLIVGNEFETRKGGVKTPTSYVFWKCHCDCGQSKWIKAYDLKRLHAMSCGCLRSETARERRLLAPGDASLNLLLWRYQISAKKKKRPFTLTLEDVRCITSQKCHYCGAKPSQIMRNHHNNGDYIYNGIDRLDNSQGYEIGNVAACCWTCNNKKSDMNENEFIAWIKRIVLNHSGLQSILGEDGKFLKEPAEAS